MLKSSGVKLNCAACASSHDQHRSRPHDSRNCVLRPVDRWSYAWMRTRKQHRASRRTARPRPAQNREPRSTVRRETGTAESRHHPRNLSETVASTDRYITQPGLIGFEAASCSNSPKCHGGHCLERAGDRLGCLDSGPRSWKVTVLAGQKRAKRSDLLRNSNDAWAPNKSSPTVRPYKRWDQAGQWDTSEMLGAFQHLPGSDPPASAAGYALMRPTFGP